MRRFSPQAWIFATAVATAGCGGGQAADGLPREPISGSVTLDGQPLDQGSITFVPKSGDGPPVGAPIEGGSYSVSRADGPIPGEHSVNVYSRKLTGKTFPDPDDPTQTIEESFERIPPKYNLKSDLKANVEKGGSNDFDFELEGEIKTMPPAPKKGRR